MSFKNQFSPTFPAIHDKFVIVTSNALTHWLQGYKRDRGTGKETESLFQRLNIIDPRSGEVAGFTVHDIRHWLNTAYEDGGLTQDQIAILFNRKSTAANSGYLHTSAETRADRLRQAVRDGLTIGHAAAAHSKLADESPEEAEAFLAAAIKFYNPMPHGICLLNWAAEICPHSLSCFSCSSDDVGEAKPCEYLVVDQEDPVQIAEIERINRNTGAVLQVMAEDGMSDAPQFHHFESVRRSTGRILQKISE